MYRARKYILSSLQTITTPTLEQTLSTATSSGLARIVIRADREGRQSGSFWRAVAQRTQEIFPTLSEKELAIIVHGFGRARIRDKALLRQVSEKISMEISRFSSGSLSSLLVSFARLEFSSEILFNAAARHLPRIAHQLTTAQTAQVFFAFSALKFRHPTLFRILGKHSVARLVGQFEPHQLASLLASTAVLGEASIGAVLASEIAKQIDNFRAKHLTTIFVTYAKNQIHNPFMLELLVDQCFRKRSEFAASDYALVLNAIADLKIPNAAVLVDYWLSYAGKDARKLDISSLAALAAAVSKLSKGDKAEIFVAIGNRVCEVADTLTPRHLATLVHAFGKVGMQHGGFLTNAPIFAARQIEKFSLDEIAMVVGGFAKLDIQDEALMIALFKTLPGRLDREQQLLIGGGDDDLGIPVVSVVDQARPCAKNSLLVLLDMMGRFYISEETPIKKILGNISARAAELSPSDVSRVLKAAVALQLSGPELRSLLQAKFSDDRWLETCQPQLQEQLRLQLTELGALAKQRTLDQ